MNLKSLGVAVLGFAALSGCGKGAKAGRQSIETIGLPPFPAIHDNVFALNGGRTSVSYKGTMLILNPTGNPSHLAEVIRASEMTRIKSAEAKSFIGDTVDFDRRYGDSGTAVTEIKSRQEELRAFLKMAQERAQPIPLAERQKAAASWFAGITASLDLRPEDRTKLQETFASYCDAKLVEFAAHPIFAALAVGGYAERPSPNQLCESHYQERGYFQGESCSRGDYFTCIWQEGVVKSGGNVAQFLQPILEDREKTEVFRKILMADEKISAAYIGTASSSSLVKDAIFKKKIYFSKALQSAKPSAGTEASCLKLLDPTYGFICGLFARTWKNKVPEDFISAVEFSSALHKDHPDLQTISNVVKFFGQRPTVAAPSNSDHHFHALTPGHILNQPSPESLDLKPEAVSAIHSLFLGTVFSLNPEDQTIKDQKEAELTALQKDLDFHRGEKERLMNAANEALQAGINAANAGNVAFGFLDYKVSVIHEGNLMRVRVVFGGGSQAFEGCYNKDHQTAVDCPARDQAGGAPHKAALNLNPAKGRIEISMMLDDPDAVGLAFKAKKAEAPEYFMDLTADQIMGAALTLELYPNRIRNCLDILTGKALFSRDDTLLHEAGISMWEE